MKSIHSIKFIFTEEEIAHVRAVWKMLQEMDDYDYKELGEQVSEEQGDYSIASGDLINGLDAFLNFMENHVDLQNN
jgi:septation ring formation regulator EzrA